jgi:anaerobic selenocysteine-containing dehydrogenase
MKDAGLPVGATISDVARAAKRGGIFVKRTTEAATHNGANKKVAYQPPNLSSHKNESQQKQALQVITYTLPFHRSPRSGLNKWLLEVLPKNCLLINTEDAHKLGIENQDQVTLQSSDKRTVLKCTAQVVPGVRPGVVALAGGFGYRQSGAGAIIIDGRQIDPDHIRGKGANPAKLPNGLIQITKSSHKT